MRKWVPLELFPNPTPSHLQNLLFDQLICQRLQRGYQIVLLPKEMIFSAIKLNFSFYFLLLFINYFRKIIPDRPKETIIRECCLSFNHIYHRIVLVIDEQPSIIIQHFVPKKGFFLE